jgi:hypothetical protein
MTEIPADAPRSEDGHHWWDGQTWQLVSEGGESAAGGAASSASSATPAEHAGGATSFGETFSQHLAATNIHVDPATLPDANTIRQAVDYLDQWYQSLDEADKAGMDAVTTDDAVSRLLANEVAPAIPGLLDAYDAAAGVPLSHLIAYTQQALTAAEAQ